MKLILISGGVYVGFFIGGILLIVAGQDIGWALAVASQGMLGLTGVLIGSWNQKKTMMDTADVIIRGQVVNDQADVAKTKAMAGLVGIAYKQAATHFRNQPQAEEVIELGWNDVLPGDFKLLSMDTQGEQNNV